MKRFIKPLFYGLIFIGLFFLNACEKQKVEVSGTAEFSIEIQDLSSLARSSYATDSSAVSWQLLVSIYDLAGNPVLVDKIIPLYTFGPGFVSEKLELKAGDYKLTKFMVIDPTGNVVYAAPMAGSPLAYLAKISLPFKFSISPNKPTQVSPDVLAVNNQTSDKFGYASFGFTTVQPLTFWTMCVIDPGNPMVMAPVQLTDAKLTVYAPDGWRYSFKVEAKTNKFVIRGGYESYTFIVEKAGYLPLKIIVRASELNAATEQKPYTLKIPYSNLLKTLTLQPGPETGKDAMITNLEADKNFGSYKYFETTFLSEPTLTVMRSNRSLIWFNTSDLPKTAIIKKATLTLRYDLPIPWDVTAFPVAAPGSSLWYGAVLQQVIEQWDEGTVTWNNQPKTTEQNQVFISPFIKSSNGIEIDVTRLFVTTASTPLPNYGMLFRLFPVEKFPGFRFASSDNTEPLMRPRLCIFYTL